MAATRTWGQWAKEKSTPRTPPKQRDPTAVQRAMTDAFNKEITRRREQKAKSKKY